MTNETSAISFPSFKAANVPVDFETFFFSEINPVLSSKLEDVTASIQKNKICLKVSALVFCQLDFDPNSTAMLMFTFSIGFLKGNFSNTRLQSNW